MAKLPALPYVRQALTNGLSANAAYRQYQSEAREAGFTGSRRQDFLRLYSQTSRLRAQAVQAVDRPKNTVPSSDEIVRRDTVHARGYGQWVAVFQRTKGTSDFISTPYLIKTSEPITPEEAEQMALANLDTGVSGLDRTTLGVTYTGTEQFNPSDTL